MKPTTDFPFLLDNPRAWRTYLGGRMLDALHGDSNGEDGHFPEEWILPPSPPATPDGSNSPKRA